MREFVEFCMSEKFYSDSRNVSLTEQEPISIPDNSNTSFMSVIGAGNINKVDDYITSVPNSYSSDKEKLSILHPFLEGLNIKEYRGSDQSYRFASLLYKCSRNYRTPSIPIPRLRQPSFYLFFLLLFSGVY
jgi:hypothetical protein